MSPDMMYDGEYKKTTLPNGMRVVTENIPYVRSVAIGFWIMGGSRIEPDPVNGVTHFIEHMLFKGTKTRTARDIAIEIDSIGGHLDAFTSREYTCFLVNCLDENLSIAMDLLVDILLNPTFPIEEMERERGVILEEIRSVEDTPDEYIHELLTERFWGNHQLGRPIIGTRSIISGLSRDALRKYYRMAYQPQRIVLAAAGNLQHEQICKMVEDIIPVPAEPTPWPSQTEPLFQSHRSFKEKELEQVHICIGVPSISHTDEDRYAGYLLNTVLGSGLSSRLFQSIREERGLAYSVYSYGASYKDSGMLVVYAGTKKESAEEVVSLVLKEFQMLKEAPVGREELKKAQNQLKGGMMLGLESTVNRMGKLGKQEIYFERTFSLSETIEAIDRVTGGDIMRLARRIIDDKHVNLASIGPLNGIPLGTMPLKC